MKFFIDTEFREEPNTIDLISIAIVSEDNKSYYALNKNCDLIKSFEDDWLRKNVFQIIYDEYISGKLRQEMPFELNSIQWIFDKYGKNKEELKKEIINFVGDKPEFYGYYSNYDWVVFCWIFGRMIDLPRNFPMYCRDLKQIMDELELDKRWKDENCPEPKNAHSALEDAKWNLKLYKSIKKMGK